MPPFATRHVALLLPNSNGVSNLGDLLLQDVLVRALRVRDVRLLPDHTRSIRDILSNHAVLIAAASARRFGSNVSATLVYPVGQTLVKSPKNLPSVMALLGYLAVLKVLGVRIIILSRGVMCRALVNSVQEYGLSRLAEYYSLRDRDSIASVGATGVRWAAWFPDLSWLAASQAAPRSRRSSLVLCFRSNITEGGDAQLAASILGSLDAILREATNAGIKEFLLVQHHEEDAPITEAIESTYGSAYRVKRLLGVLSLADVPRVYGDAAMVVSNRLHSLLIGLQCGAQPLALLSSEETKIRNQFRDIGLAGHIVELAASGIEPGLVDRIMARRDATTKAVTDYRQSAMYAASAALASLFPGARDEFRRYVPGEQRRLPGPGSLRGHADDPRPRAFGEDQGQRSAGSVQLRQR